MEIEIIKEKNHAIRGQKVMLDFYLALLYDTETKLLKQDIRRNLNRFPADFMFESIKEEFDNLRLQFVTSSYGGMRYLPLSNKKLQGFQTF